jgi:hypothetical protein
MKIYLSPNTAGRYGGALNGNLRHLNRYIQSELDSGEFKSSFDELWLTLSYPPMYVLPGVVGMEVDFKKYYDKFPYSRLSRRYKKIDITLKAPEFSEHFDKEEQKKYKHRFEIDSKYQDISETELARVLIEKYLKAGQIIKNKLKKEDIFEYELFNRTLLDIKNTIDSEFLSSLNESQKSQVQDETILRAKKLREERRLSNKTKDKRIRDIRVYYNSLPNKALYPYDYQYTEIFLNILASKEFSCPTYHHLYIQVAKTEEEALKNSFAIEDWYVNGISQIDFENYQKESEDKKEIIVLETLIQGLRDIVEIDKLDETIFEETVDLIKKQGLNTELTYKTVENKNLILTITYYSKSMEEKCPVFFNLTDKNSNVTKRIEIGKAENNQIHMWLQKITLTNKLIKVKSSESVRADVWLKDLPRKMEFEVAEIMKEKSL